MNRWVLLALCGMFIILSDVEVWYKLLALCEALLAASFWKDK